MDRRRFHQRMGGLAAMAGLPRVGAGIAARGPNILFIVADDLGYADLSITGRTD